MTARLDEADLELLRVLGRRTSATIQELCADRGVTETAIRRRLDRLRSMGLVDRRAESEGPGRPRHRYSITQQGRAELGDNYATLAQVLWQAIQSIDDADVKRRVLERVRRELIARFVVCSKRCSSKATRWPSTWSASCPCCGSTAARTPIWPSRIRRSVSSSRMCLRMCSASRSRSRIAAWTATHAASLPFTWTISATANDRGPRRNDGTAIMASRHKRVRSNIETRNRLR